jgi:hypothetical protein
MQLMAEHNEQPSEGANGGTRRWVEDEESQSRERLRSQKPKTEEPGTGTESTDVSVIRRACLGGPKFTEFPIFQILGNTNPFTNFQSFNNRVC